MNWGTEFEDHRADSAPLRLGLTTLVLGAAIGIAALFLARSGGQDPRFHFRTTIADWKASAADTLSRSREHVIAAIERDHDLSSGSQHPAGPSVRPA